MPLSLALPLPQDRDGNLMTCANNCRGVDPNSVIIGGSAVLAAAALGAQSFILPAVGMAGVGGVGAVGLAMAMQPCNNGQCLVRTIEQMPWPW